MDDLLREFLTETSENLDGVDLRGESYRLLIDQIGEVLRLADDSREENPVNLDPAWPQLMVVLDVDRVLEIMPTTAFAA